MDNWEIALSVMVGVGLSAACGFRVFIPPLVLCIAGKAGHVTFGQEFVWMDSNVALAAFGLAALLEVGAYYIPWLDNALDTVATPAAVVAGTLTSASVFGQDMSPWLKWSLAAIAGGGAAGAVQLTTTVTRGASSALTGGSANWMVSTGEGVGAVITAILAIVVIAATLWLDQPETAVGGPIEGVMAMVMLLAVILLLFMMLTVEFIPRYADRRGAHHQHRGRSANHW